MGSLGIWQTGLNRHNPPLRIPLRRAHPYFLGIKRLPEGFLLALRSSGRPEFGLPEMHRNADGSHHQVPTSRIMPILTVHGAVDTQNPSYLVWIIGVSGVLLWFALGLTKNYEVVPGAALGLLGLEGPLSVAWGLIGFAGLLWSVSLVSFGEGVGFGRISANNASTSKNENNINRFHTKNRCLFFAWSWLRGSWWMSWWAYPSCDAVALAWAETCRPKSGCEVS